MKVAVFAIITISLLTGFALSQGIDGAVYLSGASLIAGLGGYTLAKRKSKP